MAGKNRAEKRIMDERIRSAFRAGERHARALGALAADADGARLRAEGGAASNARVDRLHERVERGATRVNRELRELRAIAAAASAENEAAEARRERDEARAEKHADLPRELAEARRAREALLRERNAIAEAAAGLLDEIENTPGLVYGEQGERLAALLAGDAPEGDGEACGGGPSPVAERRPSAGEAAPDIGNEAL